jgi:hypothetical protein
MKSNYVFIMLVFISGLFACNKQESPQEGDCLAIVIDQDLFDNGIQDPTTVINDVQLEENCLIMSVSYSGGCQEHDIKLVTDGFESFSNPPTWTFKLLHENTDPCEAYLTEDWEYDINSLMYTGSYLEMDIEGYSDKIIVDLN